MDRLPVEIIRIIAGYVRAGCDDLEQGFWDWIPAEKCWILRSHVFRCTTISARWQEAIEETIIPRKLSFQSNEFPSLRPFFRYSHRRANLKHLEYIIPNVPATTDIVSATTERWTMLGGDPAISLKDYNLDLLNFLCEVYELFAELSTWTRCPGMSTARLSLSVEARSSWNTGAANIDSQTAKSMCSLIRNLCAVPFIHGFSLVAPDLPPCLATELLRCVPNVNNLRLHFSMPRESSQGPENHARAGIEHSSAEQLGKLAFVYLRSLSYTYDVRPETYYDQETQLRLMMALGKSMIRFTRRHTLDNLHIYGPFDPFQAIGMPDQNLPIETLSTNQSSASSTLLGLPLRHLTVNTVNPDLLAGVVRRTNAEETLELLSAVRPQRLENWPATLVNMENPTVLVRELAQSYLKLDDQKRAIFDAVVPGLAAFHALQVGIPYIKGFHYADAAVVYPNVIHYRVMMFEKESNLWGCAWPNPVIRMAICNPGFTTYARDAMPLVHLATMLWHVLTQEPSMRRFILSGSQDD